MKKSRFSEEQIMGVLKQREAGVKTAELYREHGISAATFYQWKSKHGGMEVSEAQWLKALEAIDVSTTEAIRHSRRRANLILTDMVCP
jgi:putative transposase